MITGIHAIVYTKYAEALRAFFRDALELPDFGLGGDGLIFALPPAEMGVHPDDDASHELYSMCADLEGTVNKLKAKGVKFQSAVCEQPWGRLPPRKSPCGGRMSRCQPTHPTARGLK